MSSPTLSDAGRKDPAMLGSSGYERNEHDFYPTPRTAFDALIEVVGDDLAGYIAWEPCCGDGAIAEPLREFVRDVITTDIAQHNGYQADRLMDFLRIFRDDETEAHDQFLIDNLVAEDPGFFPLLMSDIAALREANGGDKPGLIVTNPPYGKDAERIARHAIHLMEPERGMVAMLCRHEWDCAKSRSDLFDHPAFAMKITLRHRPRWIAGSTGAPRHNYAWFIWDWTKVDPATGQTVIAPELKYAR